MQNVKPVLSISGLSKNYGRIQAVKNLSLEVNQGTIYGILGPNGSGKTTTLGMVLNVINPTGGAYQWFGEEPKKEHLKSIGAILESPLFYPYLSGERNLKIVAEIKGVSYKKIAPILDRVGLLSRKDSKFKTYSLGMKQRLALAGALLADPRVLILDEPTNGLDPQGIADIRNLIVEIAKEGTTIILASHLLDEVEKVCSHVAVLKSGTLLFNGPVEGVINSQGQFLLGAENSDALEGALKNWEGIQIAGKKEGLWVVTATSGLSATELNHRLFEQGIVLSHLSLRKNTLEEGFLQMLANSES